MDEDRALQLLELDRPSEGMITARLPGDPTLAHVHGIGDAVYTALIRGVDLRVPRSIFEQVRDDFPPVLPPYIRVE